MIRFIHMCKSRYLRTFVAMVIYVIAVVTTGSSIAALTMANRNLTEAQKNTPGPVTSSNRGNVSYKDFLGLGKFITSSEDFDSLFYRVNILDELTNCIHGTPFQPIDGYKNNCWMSKMHTYDPYRLNSKTPSTAILRMSELVPVHMNPAGFRWRMRCFPAAMVIGVSKSGTTDLFDRSSRHPEIFSPARKEIRFWNRQRIGRLRMGPAVNMTFTDFLDYFDLAADNIMNYHKITDGKVFHPGITMEATPHYLWDYEGWEQIPGNSGLLEPRYILAHTLYAIQPQLKFIVILRNPTERLYSQFHMLSLKHPPSVCHRLVEKSIKLWNKCLESYTVRGCAYNATLNPYEYTNPGGMTLRAGMYAIYLRDWFSVYPRSQFLIIKAEKYYQDTPNTLKTVFSFLNVSSMTDPELLSLENGKILNGNEQKPRSSKAPMLKRTRKLLDDFYRPFNQQLVSLLNDEDFFW